VPLAIQTGILFLPQKDNLSHLQHPGRQAALIIIIIIIIIIICFPSVDPYRITKSKWIWKSSQFGENKK
jgi:hypothetical protein